MIQIEMEMPKRCGECRFASAFDCLVNGKFITDHNERAEHCPLQERPHGEWVWKKDKDSLRTYDLLCSKCGCKIFTCENYDSIEQAQKTVDDLVKGGKKMPNYCSDCGSDNSKKGDENA